MKCVLTWLSPFLLFLLFWKILCVCMCVLTTLCVLTIEIIPELILFVLVVR